MSNGSGGGTVNVNFPSKMRVEAPDLEARLNELLRASAAIHNAVEHGFEETTEALNVLRTLPKLVQELQKELVAQFADAAQLEMATRMAIHGATILSLEQKMDSARTYQKQLGEKLEEDTAKQKKVYEALFEDIKKDCEQYIRLIDSHAFDLLDRIFVGIENQLRTLLVRTWNTPREHLLTTMNGRQLSLDEGLDHLDGPVKHFLGEREKFHATLDRLVRRERGDGAYDLPVVMAEVEEIATGAKSLHVIPAIGPGLRLSSSLAAAVQRVVGGEVAGAARAGLDLGDAAMIAEELKAAGVPQAGISQLLADNVEWMQAGEVRR